MIGGAHNGLENVMTRTPERKAQVAAAQRRRYRRLRGLPEDCQLVKGDNRRNGWKTFELEFLKDNWDRLSVAQLAKHLSRTEQSVRCKAHALGFAPKTRILNAPRRPAHPLPPTYVEPSVQELVRAREAMKRLPGPLVRGFRVTRTWRP